MVYESELVNFLICHLNAFHYVLVKCIPDCCWSIVWHTRSTHCLRAQSLTLFYVNTRELRWIDPLLRRIDRCITALKMKNKRNPHTAALCFALLDKRFHWTPTDLCKQNWINNPAHGLTRAERRRVQSCFWAEKHINLIPFPHQNNVLGLCARSGLLLNSTHTQLSICNVLLQRRYSVCSNSY